MRIFVGLALAFAVCGSACAQDQDSKLETQSNLNQCYSVDQCLAFIELQKTKAELFSAVDDLIERPEDIKKEVMRKIYETNRQRYNYVIERNPLLDLYSKEEVDDFYARQKKEPQLYIIKTSDREGNLMLHRSDVKSIACNGVTKQGGAVLCQTQPNAKVKVARSNKDFYFESADEKGQIIIGFDRDETKNFVEVAGQRVSFDLKPREYDTSRIDGLPPSQVSTFSEAQLKRIRSSSARKKTGFASRAKEMGFKDGFDLPIKADFIKTTNFGAQRILNGEPKKPHYGVDLAAPVGTPIYAPADGVVSLADDDLYFEGAMVLLDHGQGLISMYLHTDEILVEPGQAVKQGEQIATVGSKGRSTGPHLCWRLKWRNRNLDPLLLTEWPQNG